MRQARYAASQGLTFVPRMPTLYEDNICKVTSLKVYTIEGISFELMDRMPVSFKQI